jgi:hypothetical protein
MMKKRENNADFCAFLDGYKRYALKVANTIWINYLEFLSRQNPQAKRFMEIDISFFNLTLFNLFAFGTCIRKLSLKRRILSEGELFCIVWSLSVNGRIPMKISEVCRCNDQPHLKTEDCDPKEDEERECNEMCINRSCDTCKIVQCNYVDDNDPNFIFLKELHYYLYSTGVKDEAVYLIYNSMYDKLKPTFKKLESGKKQKQVFEYFKYFYVVKDPKYQNAFHDLEFISPAQETVAIEKHLEFSLLSYDFQEYFVQRKQDRENLNFYSSKIFFESLKKYLQKKANEFFEFYLDIYFNNELSFGFGPLQVNHTDSIFVRQLDRLIVEETKCFKKNYFSKNL